jgi:DNA-binding Lrp family transcriptional regulator
MSWSAQVSVKWKPQNWKKTNWETIREWKEVKSAWSTMGDWDMILWVDVKTPEELENFVVNKLRAQDWVTDTWSTWTNQVWSRSA